MPATFNIGDRFQRPGGAKPAYRVIQLIEFPKHPPHVMLMSENPDRRTITIGAEVLMDHRQWLPVE